MTLQEELFREVECLLLQAKEAAMTLQEELLREVECLRYQAVDHDLRKLIVWEALGELLLSPLTPDQVRLVNILVRCIW